VITALHDVTLVQQSCVDQGADRLGTFGQRCAADPRGAGNKTRQGVPFHQCHFSLAGEPFWLPVHVPYRASCLSYFDLKKPDLS
jgi:hypothetical protein